MTYIKAMLVMSLMMLVGCSAQPSAVEEFPPTPGDKDHPAVSGMVDPQYLYEGELKEIDGNKLLVNFEERGLTWVTIEDDTYEGLSLHATVEVQISGPMLESYPMQASGRNVVVTKPFLTEPVFTYEAMNALLADGDMNPVVVWNKNKDTVAYATRDLEAGGYRIFVASLYEEEPWEVARSKEAIPDLNWQNALLEVQVGEEFWNFGPDFGEEEVYVFGEM